jgi:hypothetical protein
MSIRNYSLLAFAVFILVCTLTHYTRIVPVPPVAILLFAGLTGLAFQMEDGKLSRMLHEILSALHDDRRHHAH